MAVAQSPIINNTASARWYRKAVRAGVMEIHSLLWEHGGRIFSSSSAPSPLLSPRPVTLRLRSSLCHSPFCLGIAFFSPPIWSFVRPIRGHLTRLIGLTKLYCSFKAAETERVSGTNNSCNLRPARSSYICVHVSAFVCVRCASLPLCSCLCVTFEDYHPVEGLIPDPSVNKQMLTRQSRHRVRSVAAPELLIESHDLYQQMKSHMCYVIIMFKCQLFWAL